MCNATYFFFLSCSVFAAARAIQELNYIPLYGRPIRVMYSHRDPSVRLSGAGNIFIKVHSLSLSLPLMYEKMIVKITISSNLWV